MAPVWLATHAAYRLASSNALGRGAFDAQEQAKLATKASPAPTGSPPATGMPDARTLTRLLRRVAPREPFVSANSERG